MTEKNKNYWQSYFDKKAKEEDNIYKRVGFVSEKNTELVRNTVRSYVGKPVGKKIMDAGCGDGMVLSHLAQDNEIDGYDFSKNMLKLAAEQGLNPIYSDLTNPDLPFENYDIAISVEAVTLLPDPIQTLIKIAQSVKPNGVAVFSVLNKFSIIRGIASLIYKYALKKTLPQKVSYFELKACMAKEGFSLESSTFVYWLPGIYLNSSASRFTTLKLLFANNIIFKFRKNENQ